MTHLLRQKYLNTASGPCNVIQDKSSQVKTAKKIRNNQQQLKKQQKFYKCVWPFRFLFNLSVSQSLQNLLKQKNPRKENHFFGWAASYLYGVNMTWDNSSLVDTDSLQRPLHFLLIFPFYLLFPEACRGAVESPDRVTTMNPKVCNMFDKKIVLQTSYFFLQNNWHTDHIN